MEPNFQSRFLHVCSQKEVSKVAAAAAETAYNLGSRNRIHRELEGYESNIFKALVPAFDSEEAEYNLIKTRKPGEKYLPRHA